jgi:hypothetical protein
VNLTAHPPAERASGQPDAELGRGQDGQDGDHRRRLIPKVIAGAGTDGNSRAGGQRDQSSGGKSRPEPLRFPRITCAELDTTEYRIEYLIESTLVAGHPVLASLSLRVRGTRGRLGNAARRYVLTVPPEESPMRIAIEINTSKLRFEPVVGRRTWYCAFTFLRWTLWFQWWDIGCRAGI